ncbi:hypothetical protein D3C80_2022000 [compost metagenome]
MQRDSNKVLRPDDPMYTDAVEALRQYHQAQAAGVTICELERLRLLAEHRFQAVTDYQLHALGGPAEPSH